MPNDDDVRMKGFARRAPVAAAQRWVCQAAARLESEYVTLADALGRVLAEDPTATMDVPPFDRSAMDGFAVRSTDLAGATGYDPVPLRVIGQSLPGQPTVPEVLPRTAVRIMTGAPLPKGADAVVPAEFARQDDAGMVWIETAVPAGKHIGRRGEDVTRGTVLFRAGRRLLPQDLGVLASTGITRLRVVRQPRVRLLITGNELAPAGHERQKHQIHDANGPMLHALARRDGARLDAVVHVPDDRQRLRRAIAAGCKDADVLLISGGSSVGSEDYAPLLVAELGELPIHGVAIRPAAPTGIGRIGSTLVFLLPGNPVSCLCAYDFFAGPAIRALQGLPFRWPYRSRVLPLARKIASALGRVDYCRVRIEAGRVFPLAVSGASILTSTTRADGFVVVPEDSEGFPPDTPVRVFLYQPEGITDGDDHWIH